MAFELPALQYANDALEPNIDARTMEIHHDKHHNTYVTNLNNALKDLPELAAMDINDLLQNLDKVPESARTAVRNNGGGHANHTLFWDIMGPNGGGAPTGVRASPTLPCRLAWIASACFEWQDVHLASRSSAAAAAATAWPNVRTDISHSATLQRSSACTKPGCRTRTRSGKARIAPCPPSCSAARCGCRPELIGQGLRQG